MDESKETPSFRYDRTDAHMNSDAVAAHTRPAQVQARWGSSTERGIGHGRLLLTKKLSATDTDLQRKIVFSNEVPLSILTILQGMWSLTVKLTLCTHGSAFCKLLAKGESSELG